MPAMQPPPPTGTTIPAHAPGRTAQSTPGAFAGGAAGAAGTPVAEQPAGATGATGATVAAGFGGGQ